MKTARTLALVAAVMAVGAVFAPSAAALKIVETRGGLVLKPNEALSQTHRFAPGHMWIKPGGIIRWEDRDRTVEPHTIMVVRQTELPATVNQIFACPVCAGWRQHLNDPNDENSGIGHLRVNVGAPGLQAYGDSLYLQNRHVIRAVVNARVNRVIHYMCAFHPWMQGAIHVTRTGMPPMHHRG